MLTYDEFLTFIVPEKVDDAKRFESYFLSLYSVGTLPTFTLGFIVELPDLEDDPQYWADTIKIIELFNPLNIWIGTEENRRTFNAEYPHIAANLYPFFEESAFIPVVAIPASLVSQFK